MFFIPIQYQSTNIVNIYLLGVVGGCDNKNYVNYNLEYAKHCNGCVKVFVGNLSYKHVPLNFSEINLKK